MLILKKGGDKFKQPSYMIVSSLLKWLKEGFAELISKKGIMLCGSIKDNEINAIEGKK